MRSLSPSTYAPHFDPRAIAEYERCFADPATIHASCEDYRAAASIDLAHDVANVAAGRKVTCPLLALWGEKGVVNRLFKPLEDWAQVATDVRGRALPSGHYLAEEARTRRAPSSWRSFACSAIDLPTGPSAPSGLAGAILAVDGKVEY